MNAQNGGRCSSAAVVHACSIIKGLSVHPYALNSINLDKLVLSIFLYVDCLLLAPGCLNDCLM